MHTPFSPIRGMILATLLALPLAAGADGDAAPLQVEVTIKKMKFQPAEVTVKRGGSVRWVNREKRQYHNVWFEALGEEEPDYLFPEDVYERRFDEAGDFPYRCGPHPEMRGIVHVME